MGCTRFWIVVSALSCALVSGCTDNRGLGEGSFAGHCTDGVDNDRDGRLDCSDPGCASQCGIVTPPSDGGIVVTPSACMNVAGTYFMGPLESALTNCAEIGMIEATVTQAGCEVSFVLKYYDT